MFIYEPPDRTQVKRSMPRQPATRRVDLTIEHVSRGWIPVNPAILKQVQEKLAGGEYKSSPEKLVEDLKSDPGLFIHAARNLKAAVEDLQTGIDPAEQLASLEEEKLKKIFSVSEKQISSHHLRDMRLTQALRLQHSVISSRVAEAIAARSNVAPGLAFSAALFRQLGHDLIAWNYPDIYARAVSAQRNRQVNATAELRKFLGVTPLQISAKFAQDWNMKPELRMALAPAVDEQKSGVQAPAEEDENHLSLKRLCEVSELFAQANDPQHYPAAREKWKETEAGLPDIITPDLYHDIQGYVFSALELCEKFVPKMHSPAYFKRKTADHAMTEKARAMYLGNYYIRRCPDELRAKIVTVYENLRDQGVSIDALRILVDDVVPASGFARGCLYMLDQKTLNLKPVLRMGDMPLSSYRVVRIHESHPVAEALGSQIPFKQGGEGAAGNSAVHICGSLGPASRPGVLYLELENSEPEARIYPHPLFQAIKQCLIDCLGDNLVESK